MIEKLTESKLKQYKFDSETIEKLNTWDTYEAFLLNDGGIYWASNVKKQIHSGIDGARKYYFRDNEASFPQHDLDLVPEYYNILELKYLKKQKQIAGILFDNELAREDFRVQQIDAAKELIDNLEAHPMYNRLSSKQGFVEKLNWYLKWLNKLNTEGENKNYDEKINWFEIYKDIDIQKKIKLNAYQINTLEQKVNYFSKASFNLTTQYLQDFKKKTYLLSDKRKLEYLQDLNIERPKMGISKSAIHNQTVFEAQSNFYDFIQDYQKVLSNQVSKPDFKKMNEANKLDLLHIRLASVAYFAPIDHGTIKINMFSDYTNDEFREIVKEELDAIRNAEAAGNKSVPDPYRSRDIMHLSRVYEVKNEDLVILFNDKFNDAKRKGFKTPERFAKHELDEIESRYKIAAKWFPVFEQWKELLKVVAEKGIVLKKEQQKITPKTNTPDFSLRQIAIAHCILKIVINRENANTILKKYSKLKSIDKLIQKRINKSKDLLKVSDNKTAATKHLNDLNEAKRLISGTKDKNAKIEIERIITEFKKEYDLKY